MHCKKQKVKFVVNKIAVDLKKKKKGDFIEDEDLTVNTRYFIEF